MSPATPSIDNLLQNCHDLIASLYARCTKNAPNYNVAQDCFENALSKAAKKYLCTDENNLPNTAEIEQFLSDLQIQDLFLALACANGNEYAWWEFDQQHRSYLERIARHLASSELNATEVVDSVYVELYGTRIVDGVRQSKFATYTGRGSLRGWLRTIVWHALVDLHRAGHDEVSLDEMTETVGEGHAHAAFLENARGGENEMLDEIVRDRYRKATLSAMETAFSTLGDHEKLLLLYYHVENLKLREIARLVEIPKSPLRSWFQRRSATRENAPDARVHESTVMRWLEKTYEKVLRIFKNELTRESKMKDTEIELCVEIATRELAHSDFSRHLASATVAPVNN